MILLFNTDYSSPITKKYFNKQIIKKYNSFAYTTIIEHKKIKMIQLLKFLLKMVL